MENSSVVDSYGMAVRNSDDQEETSTFVQTHTTERNPTEWTDEKHSLFLKSMEATFVNQLYNHPHKNPSSNYNSASSNKFKVLRGGRWSRVDFKREEAQLNQENGVLLTNPWVKHYRCGSGRQPIRKFSSTSRAKVEKPSHNFRLWRQDSVGSDTEATGQNFNDEDITDEKCGMIHGTKRTRTSTDTVSSNDQVVPFENNVRGEADSEDHET